MQAQKLLLDINVVLDVLLDRPGFAAASAAVWEQIEARGHEGFLAGHAFPTIHYLIRKAHGAGTADKALADLRRVFDVGIIDGAIVERALELRFPDFEDALTAASAERMCAHYVVTRDLKGFAKSPVPAISPQELLALPGWK